MEFLTATDLELRTAIGDLESKEFVEETAIVVLAE